MQKPSIAAFIMAFVLFPAILSGQDTEEFREFEDSLVSLSHIIYSGSGDQMKEEANEAFMAMMRDALSLKNSFRYPFDSLNLVSIQVSPDNRLRLITWMIARSNGTYSYYGFVQSYSRRDNDYVVYELTDLSDQIEQPETKVLDHKSWYGAVYYDIIYTRSGQQRYYTLLGWDGNDPLVRRKIIEVVTLRSNGMPRFGHNLFRYEISQQRRIFFEYSSLTTMNLRYERQHYHEKRTTLFNRRRSAQRRPGRGGNTNPGFFERLRYRIIPGNPDLRPLREGRNRYVRKADHLIIFDNLVPLDHTLAGQKQFYIPEGNIVNGFRFSNGRWRFIEDVDARNPRHRFDRPSKRPQPEMAPGRN